MFILIINGDLFWLIFIFNGMLNIVVLCGIEKNFINGMVNGYMLFFFDNFFIGYIIVVYWKMMRIELYFLLF